MRAAEVSGRSFELGSLIGSRHRHRHHHCRHRSNRGQDQDRNYAELPLTQYGQ